MTEELKKLLQECDTLKARLVALRPLPAEALKKIDEALAVEYTYESNRIEGNTLTLQETELVVNEGVTIASQCVSTWRRKTTGKLSTTSRTLQKTT